MKGLNIAPNQSHKRQRINYRVMNMDLTSEIDCLGGLLWSIRGLAGMY